MHLVFADSQDFKAFSFFSKKGPARAKTVKTRKNKESGLVAINHHCSSNITMLCPRRFSSIPPRIKPIARDTTENPYLLIKNPSTPKKIIIQTSNID